MKRSQISDFRFQNWLCALCLLCGLCASAVGQTPNAGETPAPQKAAATTRPVAVWFQPLANLPKMAELGITHVFGPELENPPVCTLEQWAAKADQLGLKVVLKIKAGETPAPQKLPANCVGLLISVDEPNGKGVLPAAIKAEYDKLKKAYPGVPVFLSLAGDKITSANFARLAELALYRDYLASCDVVTVNAYSMNRNAARYKVTWTADAVRKIKTISDKPVWAWIECSDQKLLPPPPTPGVARGPTAAEIAGTATAAIEAGADGIGFFATAQNGWARWPASFWSGVVNGEQEAAVAAISLSVAGPRGPPEATKPDHGQVAQATSIRPLRVWCESNPTPIPWQNPQWVDDGKGTSPDQAGQVRWVRVTPAVEQAQKLGLRPILFCYDGTLNRVPCWPDRPGGEILLDAQGNWRSGNHSDPPTEAQVRRVAQLARASDFYEAADKNVRPTALAGWRPLIFDIEAAKTIGAAYTGPTAPLAVRQKMLLHWIDTVKWAKAGSEQQIPVWVYSGGNAWPDAGNDDTRDLQKQLLALTGAACVTLYNWDVPTATGGESWFDDAAAIDSQIKQHAPHLQKIAVILPYWQVYWPAKPETAAKNNTAIDLAVWKRQVDWLAANGWDIVLWLGYAKAADVRPHTEYLASKTGN